MFVRRGDIGHMRVEAVEDDLDGPRITRQDLPSKEYDSLNYDVCYNVPYKRTLRGYGKWTYVHTTVMRWIMVAVIGCLTGFTGFVIQFVVLKLWEAKLSDVFHVVYSATMMRGTVVLSFLPLLGLNIAFALVSSVAAALQPVSAGSGIPEIKCYLNGIKIPDVVKAKTYFAKVVGSIFTVSAGFVAGKQDPMVHIGAIIGAGIPQLRSMILCFKKIKFPYPHFRSDRDKRDFVSCGAAAGMAAAFGAPIGGTLFALEEGSSFWNQGLTWRTLFCAFCATYTLNLLRSGVERSTLWNVTQSTGLVNFGSFGNAQGKNSWTLLHLLCFVLMGVFGGLTGAVFNSLNTRITVYRMKYLQKRHQHRIWRILEILLVVITTSFVLYICAMLFGTCVPVNKAQQSVGSTLKESYSYFCPENETGLYINDMASLLFQPMEFVVRNLLHNQGPYTLSTLGICFFLYFLLSCFTFGIGISGGLFMPCLVIGATYGRFVATVLLKYCPAYFYFMPIYFGTYALIGAASFLAGVMRMSLSLTVILMESTQDITYGLPILFTVTVAKWVGDIFNTGIYHIHITLKKMPHLDWESPLQMNRLVASDVMHTTTLHLFPITRVRSLINVLRVSSSSAFPVVCLDHRTAVTNNMVGQHMPLLYTMVPEKGHSEQQLSSVINRIKKKQKLVLCGMILRFQLIMLLKGKVFFQESMGPAAQREMSYDEMMADYPRSDDIFEMEFTEEEKDQLMDLSLYMNPSLYCVSSQTPFFQVFNLFRTMGLRHLPVLDETSHNLVGMITRFDLTHENLREQQRKREINSQL